MSISACLHRPSRPWLVQEVDGKGGRVAEAGKIAKCFKSCARVVSFSLSSQDLLESGLAPSPSIEIFNLIFILIISKLLNSLVVLPKISLTINRKLFKE